MKRTIAGRQGDIVFEKVSAVPKGAKKLDNKRLQFNSEFGPGHSHVLDADEVFQGTDGTNFVVVNEPTQMTHPEHPSLDLAPGIYTVRQVRDFTPRRNMLD